MSDNSRVNIFTDGACKGNPGRGGWAAVLIQNGVQRTISGSDPRTTNNRMELMAAIKGLEAAFEMGAKEVVIYSDSAYLVNTMTKGWKRNANHNLWEHLDRLKDGRQVTWKWVRGHNGTPGNEMADKAASREAGLLSPRGGYQASPSASGRQGLDQGQGGPESQDRAAQRRARRPKT